MFRVLMLARAALVLALFAACTSPCEELAREVCSCRATRAEIDACVRRANAQTSQAELTEDDQQQCEALLDVCDCRALDTAEGKQNCGQAP